MLFRDHEHYAMYCYFKEKDETLAGDEDRYSLFYLLSLNRYTREHIDDLYDFRNHLIKRDGQFKDWQTSESEAITKLAFNLYGGINNNKGCYSYDVNSIYSSVSSMQFIFLNYAIELKFGLVTDEIMLEEKRISSTPVFFDDILY